jgi:hypothetical protein
MADLIERFRRHVEYSIARDKWAWRAKYQFASLAVSCPNT